MLYSSVSDELIEKIATLYISRKKESPCTVSGLLVAVTPTIAGPEVTLNLNLGFKVIYDVDILSVLPFGSPR